METYLVEPGNHKRSIKQIAISILGFALVYSMVMIVWNLFWPSPYEVHKGPSWMALKITFISLFWGAGMTFIPTRYARCKLLVDDQSITSIAEFSGGMKWYKRSKTISAGKVRTIREVPNGLLASEEARLGAWMWGGVFISRTLPEYERLKGLVESWRAPVSRN